MQNALSMSKVTANGACWDMEVIARGGSLVWRGKTTSCLFLSKKDLVYLDVGRKKS